MNRRWKFILVGALALVIVVLGVGQAAVQARAGANDQAPRFEVDPFWPRPLPNHWVLGSSIGLWVDDQDIVWMIHRSSATLGNNERGLELDPPTGECCAGAPPVLAFDQEGNLVHAWGGPGQGYEWPSSNHGIFVDHLGYVWIGGNGGGDSHVLKSTKDGRFVAQFGRENARMTGTNPAGQPIFTPNSHDPNNFGRVAKIFVDPTNNEAYLSDGYFNRRVAVINGETGEMLRYWGAYGNAPDDNYEFGPRGANAPPAQQFRGPVHCAGVARDGQVYVCDRQSNRIQVFSREGRFIREAFYAPASLGEGSTWDIAFSRDPQQRYIYIADGRNMKVRVVDRESLQELTNFGDGGRQPGQFYAVHSIATDSRGNIYTTETYEGKRIQRFMNRGVQRIPAFEQGTPWPATR
jgi:DNA-binding beta-propeller fold protein YncE